LKPFIKWAGGKRWILKNGKLKLPHFEGRYIEPFLGGGAVFFHLAPKQAILSDFNFKLIETYKAVKEDWVSIVAELKKHQELHCKEYYYEQRAEMETSPHKKAAQFLYLNRTCFNGLYRENLKGIFNVPIGTKTKVLLPDDDFESASKLLRNASLDTCDFEQTLQEAKVGDLVFLDPPYTTAHNMNGFIKYNSKIFSWDDQLRLHRCVLAAKQRGARIVLTNANHESIHELYQDMGEPKIISRSSLISGNSINRGSTSEALFCF